MHVWLQLDMNRIHITMDLIITTARIHMDIIITIITHIHMVIGIAKRRIKMEPVHIMIDFKDELFIKQKEDMSEFGNSLAYVMQSMMNNKLIPENAKVKFENYEECETAYGSKLHVFRFECTNELTV